ncbi:MAG: ATP-binding protein [Parafilimonas sp.]
MRTGNEIKAGNDLSELSLAEILNDCSIDAIIAISTNYDVIAWNKTAALMYGPSKKEAIGKSLFKLIPGLEQDEQTIDALKNALCGHKSFVPVSKQFKHRLHAENHYIPLDDNDGNVIGVMNIVHDVAHRIKAERQLQDLNEELEKRYRQLKITSEELASFTYITSNKIKEPIRQMYTGVEYLVKMEGSRLSDSGKASFRRMQSSLNRMDLLLDDILSLAQISILQKPDATVDLNELLQKVSADVEKKHEKKVNIIIKKLCTIPGHKDYLYILFYNLFDNGFKFNAADLPEIIVTCEKIVSGGQHELMQGNKYYKVTVKDNGIGFDSNDAERIFTMFEKLHDKKYKGSGTGLTIARKIMNAHDGFISAESEDGKSASFHCFFPVQD